MADVEPAGRHVEFRNDDVQPVERGVDGGGRFDVVLDAFDRRPGAGEARQGKAVEPVVDQFLDAGRIEDRDHRVDEQELGRMRVGRGFRGVVVAHQGQHAAMPGRAGEIGVAEYVAGAVDAGPLAVPDGEHAVMLAFAEKLGLLRTPAGGGCEFLVQARLEDDVGLRQLLLGLPQLQVEPAERRAAIARDEACRVEPCKAVALALHQKHPNDRLRSGQEYPLLAEIEFVVERNLVKRHQAIPLRKQRQFARLTSGRIGSSLSSLSGKVKQNHHRPKNSNGQPVRPRLRARK